ncbi:ATP-NAD kinase-like domain-containing protein [Cantharellus anzutake]|uniref:ATP-NAD kinase-like domain-containing protein n=1 Tax=Cantharellus anzutake TaxID=1750568 RepID=UPI001905240D|nr:ATP-NAD kinase-like domain-containing protein [Cantharellus anzutake]KAF8334033.1 ATP-NAD kinase-like domain-containing protein [Cantharellus anzutake]
MGRVLLIVNSNSGDGVTGKRLIEGVVCPILSNAGVGFSLHFTSSAEEAGNLAELHIASSSESGRPTILVAGGDGTLHDLVNVLHTRAGSPRSTFPGVDFVLIPTGTANALYHSFYPPDDPLRTYSNIPNDIQEEDLSKLKSLISYLEKTGRRELAVARTSIHQPDSTQPPCTILSLVVNSTSLHAATLDTAEKYRSTIPGIERFKVATAENITRWTNAEVQFLPSGDTNKFVPAQDSADPVSINGPFFYFLSTINVDRLEPEFVTTPLVRRKPAASNQALDLVVIRPTRNPKYAGEIEGARQAFVQLALPWFKAVYNGGKHLDIAYESEGELVYMTEYYRAGGWRWTPKDDDYASSLVCVDGTIVKIPAGGYAVADVLPRWPSGDGFNVWV